MSKKRNRGLILLKLVLLAERRRRPSAKGPARPGLSGPEKAILLCLAEHTGSRETCWPSYSTISNESGLCRAVVIRTIKCLTEKGILEIRSGGKSNEYKIEARKLARYIAERNRSKVARLLRRLLDPPVNGLRDTPADLHGTPEVVSSADQAGLSDTPNWSTQYTRTSQERPPERPSQTTPERDLRLSPPRDGCSDERESGGMTRQFNGFPASSGKSGKSRSGIGDVPEAIRTPWVAELIADVEPQLNNPCLCSNSFSFQNKISTGVVAGLLSSLLLGILKETGVKPTASIIADAIDSAEFRGVRDLSWGWLVTEGNHRGRSRFINEVKKRLPDPNHRCRDPDDVMIGADW